MVINNNLVLPSTNGFSLAIPEDVTQEELVSNLQLRIDNSKRDGFESYHEFNDKEILWWYLYRRTNIKKENEKSERTVKSYRRILEQFITNLLMYHNEIGLDLKIPENATNISLLKLLEERHLRRYQEWFINKSPYVLKNGPYSAATIENKMTVIKSFLQQLYRWGYIPLPVYEGFYVFAARKDERPNRDAGPNDVLKLLKSFEAIGHIPMFTLIHVLTTTGMRNEELCKLTVGDVKKDTILGGYYLDVWGKGNKNRQIPLREKTLTSIEKFRAARGLLPLKEATKSEPLFTTNRGKAYTPSYLSQYFKSQLAYLPEEVLEEFNHVSITPHLFRHAFAIISSIEGSDLYAIMRSLGHERIDTTQIYLEKIFAKERHSIQQWSSNTLDGYI